MTLLHQDIQNFNPLSSFPHNPAQFSRLNELADKNFHNGKFPLNAIGAHRERFRAAEYLTHARINLSLKAKFKTLSRLIEKEAGPNATIYFQSEDISRLSNALPQKSNRLKSEISVDSLEKYIIETFLSNLVGLDWDYLRNKLMVLIQALEHAEIRYENQDQHSYISHASFDGLDISKLVATTETFLISQYKTWFKEKKIVEQPSRIALYAMILLYALLIGGFHKSGADDYFYSPTANKYLMELPSLLGLIVDKNIESEELSIEQSIRLRMDIAEYDLLTTESFYEGPQNGESSLAELKATKPEFELAQFKHLNRFNPLFTLTYAPDSENDYGVLWSQFRLDGLVSFSHQDSTSSLPQFNQEFQTNIQDLNEFFSLDYPTTFTGGDEEIYEVVDMVKVTLGGTTPGASVFVLQVPSGSTGYFSISETNANIHVRQAKTEQTDEILFSISTTSTSPIEAVFIFTKSRSQSFHHKTMAGEIEKITSTGDIGTDNLGNSSPLHKDVLVSNRQFIPPFELLNPEPTLWGDFIQNWGIDFDRIYQEVTALPISNQHTPLPAYAPVLKSSEVLEQQELQLRISFAISRQLQEKNVKYTVDPAANSQLSSLDARTYFWAAETVGLDCDGLSFLISLIGKEFTANYRDFTFPDGGTLQNTTSFPKAIILGELDTNNDGIFGAGLNHARVPIGGSFNQMSFEATSFFPENETISPEELDAFQQKIEDQLKQDLVSLPTTEKVVPLISIFALISLSTFAGWELFLKKSPEEKYRRLTEKERKSKQRSLKNQYKNFNKKTWIKLVPKLRNLNPKQLSALPELLTYLLTETYQPTSPTQKRNSIGNKMSILSSFHFEGTNKPSLDFISSFKNMIELLNQTHYLFPQSRRTRTAIEVFLRQEAVDPEYAQVLEVILLLLQFKALIQKENN